MAESKIKNYDYEKKEIEQLHNITMEFNKNTIELKKIYIGLYPAVITLSYVFMSVNDDFTWRLNLLIFTMILTVGVWLLDSYYYYNQRKLRNKMDKLKRKAYKVEIEVTGYKLWKALINTSHLIYIYFVLMSLSAYLLSGALI